MKRTVAVPALSLALVLAAALPSAAQVVIRNVIPSVMSDEQEDNAEPFIVFNPVDPRTLAISAAVFADSGSTLGALFVSFDGGDTWERRDVIPTCMGCLNTGDITMSYNASGRFFAGILSQAVGGEVVLTSTHPTFTTPLTQIAATSPRDQPYIQSGTVFGWFDPNKERTYVAGQTASGTSTARPRSDARRRSGSAGDAVVLDRCAQSRRVRQLLRPSHRPSRRHCLHGLRASPVEHRRRRECGARRPPR